MPSASTRCPVRDGYTLYTCQDLHHSSLEQRRRKAEAKWQSLIAKISSMSGYHQSITENNVPPFSFAISSSKRGSGC
ncbi:hypothetical protein M514_23143 [Trichuris suis]|uniref:Uncharacterized protein n=1 Tax=Trichuris suis TaxID=68888 RepID=A0A085N5D9_9BILA|nr:hypothetical protein M514_23143 [Trichuris suis]